MNQQLKKKIIFKMPTFSAGKILLLFPFWKDGDAKRYGPPVGAPGAENKTKRRVSAARVQGILSDVITTRCLIHSTRLRVLTWSVRFIYERRRPGSARLCLTLVACRPPSSLHLNDVNTLGGFPAVIRSEMEAVSALFRTAPGG